MQTNKIFNILLYAALGFALFKLLQKFGVFPTKVERKESQISKDSALDTSKPNTQPQKVSGQDVYKVAGIIAALLHTGQPHPTIPGYEIRPNPTEVSTFKKLLRQVPNSTDLRNISKVYEQVFKRKLADEINEKTTQGDNIEIAEIVRRIK